jgi:uncharacterized protein (TIGR02453 family)
MPSRTAKKSLPVKTSSAQPYFSRQTLDFLRQLKRNNRREWFEARRETYESELKQPMLALIEEITHAMVDYAPGHVRPPQKSLMRIYRDTRFSADKTPYKTNLAAWWVRDGLEKTSGGGYYFHITATEVTVAAGVFMPAKEQLFAIRQHLLSHPDEFKRLIESKKLRAKFTLYDPVTLTRPPKGFPAEHAAAEWIKWRQWGISATLPIEGALKSTFAATLEAYFRLAQPLVDFLNEPLLRSLAKRKKPLFGLY